MKNFSLLSLFTIGLALAGCKGNQGQFTQLSELEDPPFQEALESRVEEVVVETKIGRKKAMATDSGQVGQNGFKEEDTVEEATAGDTAIEENTDAHTAITTVVDITIRPRSRSVPGADKQKRRDRRSMKKNRVEQRDIHFYIGRAPAHCLNTFAQDTYSKGFLSLLNDLSWRFSHSRFSAGENPPGYLEFDGKYLNDSKRTRKRRWEGVTVLHKRIQFYEDIFAYTVTPFVSNGFYHGHITAHGPDSLISYDAPQWTDKNRGGEDNPLAGLNDLLTEGYGAFRPGVFADVFIVTNQFPGYTPEEIDNFLKQHSNLRIHGLIPGPEIFQKTDIGSLRDLIEKTKGTFNHLCGNDFIGPKLAEIVADKNWSSEQEEKPKAREGKPTKRRNGFKDNTDRQ